MRRDSRRARHTVLGLAVVLGLVASGCSSEHQAGTSKTLRVYAAASLTGTFPTIAKQFEQEHPDTHVALTFAGSSDLEAQLAAGAPGDVFASADEKTMRRAVGHGLASTSTRFASNTLTIVVAPGNPAHIHGLGDLTRKGLDVVVCAPQVPCGAATGTVLAAAHVSLRPASEENAVTGVLGTVTSGQADAGIVYVTDARRAGTSVTAVAFPESAKAVNVYPIAVLSQSTNPAAQQFVDLVRASAGQSVLRKAGFAP